MTPTVVELFSGAGLAGTGLHRAGWQATLCVEWNPAAAATAVAAGFPTRCADVRDVDASTLDTPLLLWASPPCQAFSFANQHKIGLGADKGEDDLLRNGFPWALEFVSKLRSPWLVFENVRGCYDYMMGPVAEAVKALGYAHVAVWRLQAQDYGCPSSRTRIFLVAGPAPVPQPVPTHGTGMHTKPFVTMHDATGIPWHKVSPCVVATEWKWATPKTSWVKLNRAADALALATEGVRTRLTVAECTALMGMPSDYPWQGTNKEKYIQCGNGVPPMLSEAVGRAILEVAQTNQEPPKDLGPWLLRSLYPDETAGVFDLFEVQDEEESE